MDTEDNRFEEGKFEENPLDNSFDIFAVNSNHLLKVN